MIWVQPSFISLLFLFIIKVLLMELNFSLLMLIYSEQSCLKNSAQKSFLPFFQLLYKAYVYLLDGGYLAIC